MFVKKRAQNFHLFLGNLIQSRGQNRKIPPPFHHARSHRAKQKNAQRDGGHRLARYTPPKRGNKVAAAHWFSSLGPPLPDRTQNRGIALRVFRWQKLETFDCAGVRRTRHEPKEGCPIEPRQRALEEESKTGGPTQKTTVSTLYGTAC